jgi:predicted Zn-dependent protease
VGLCGFALALGTSLPQARAGADPAPEERGYWQQDTVVVYVDPSLAWLGPSAFDAVRGAAEAWQSAEPNLPTLEVRPLQHVDRDVEQAQGYNVVRFEPEGAPEAKGALAITTATAESPSRAMVDAYIVLNGEHRFAILDFSESPGRSAAYDLQNVLTHEFGHFLGLGENYTDPSATMYAESERGETKKRDLAASDRDAIADLYPTPETTASGCGGAQFAPGRAQSARWGCGLLALLLAFGRRGRRRDH